MIEATINAPSAANVGDTVTLTASFSGLDLRPTLNGNLSVQFPIGNEQTITYKDGEVKRVIAHNDTDENPVISDYNADLYFNVDGAIVFVDNKIVEQA